MNMRGFKAALLIFVFTLGISARVLWSIQAHANPFASRTSAITACGHAINQAAAFDGHVKPTKSKRRFLAEGIMENDTAPKLAILIMSTSKTNALESRNTSSALRPPC